MKQIHKRLTYANVMSSIAVFFVLGGGAAFAAIQLEKNSVGTKQLKKNAVVSSKVKNGSLKAADFAAGQLPAGAPGPQGLQGKQGPPGLSGLEVVKGSTEFDSTSRKSIFVECPAGKKVTGTGFNIDGGSGEVGSDETKEATIDEVEIQEDLSGVEFQAYEQKGGTTEEWSLDGEVICASVS
ncbi:MAG TPA: hypothetical protein VGV69_06715 [Solirubrobacterales bacterium]|nr:hypothetical protein [Solirubrobacterales bacterium]